MKPEDYKKAVKIATELANEDAKQQFGKKTFWNSNFWIDIWDGYIQKRKDFHLKNIISGKDIPNIDLKFGSEFKVKKSKN
mgnify:CR=1 FL=1